MNSKRIFIDQDIEVGEEYFPQLYSIKVNSHDEELIGVILSAGGKGPHPTVILLHGFPGYEDNHDLAHSFRRAGLNVVRFHYRGCWGVGGNFSFTNCIEDVKNIIDFVINDDTIKNYRIDKENVFLVGHSMGGFLTLTHSNDYRIKASVAISPYDFGLKGCIMKANKKELKDGIEMFSTAIDPLNGTDIMTLIKECIDNGEKWNLRNKAEELGKKDLMIIGATKDTVGPYNLHHTPLITEIYKYKNKLKEITINTDHSYSNKRIWLTKTVVEYIEDIYNRNHIKGEVNEKI